MKRTAELSWHVAQEPEHDAVSLFLINDKESMTIRLKCSKKALRLLCSGILDELTRIK